MTATSLEIRDPGLLPLEVQNQIQAGYLLLIGILLAFFLYFIKKQLQRLVDKIFFQQKYDYRKALKNFGEIISASVTREAISQKSVELIQDIMKVKGTVIALSNHRGFTVTRTMGSLDTFLNKKFIISKHIRGKIAASADQICQDVSLYSSVASCSSGVELDKAQTVVVGNVRGVGGKFRVGHSVMDDALDAEGVYEAIRSAGLDLPERARADDLDGRLVNVFVKCEADPSSRLRGYRQVMLNDSDVHHHRQVKGAVGGVVAAAVGDHDRRLDGDTKEIFTPMLSEDLIYRSLNLLACLKLALIKPPIEIFEDNYGFFKPLLACLAIQEHFC